MSPIYLLAICKPRNGGEPLTRIAKCSYYRTAYDGSVKIGEWWTLEVFENPLPAMLDTLFIGDGWDRELTAARALDTRLGGGLGRCSSVQWDCQCGAVDAEGAALVRIDLEVLAAEGE